MKTSKKVLLAYISVCIFWGSTYMAIRVGVQDMPPLFFASIRFIVAGILLLGVCKCMGIQIGADKQEWGKQSIIGILMLTFGNGAVSYAEQWVHSGIASLVVAMVPLFILVIESVYYKRLMTNTWGIIGLISGLSGIAYLSISGTGKEGINLFGIIVTLCGCLFWSVGSVYASTIKSKSNVFANAGKQMLGGGFGLLILSVVTGEVGRWNISSSGVFALAYLIIFGSIVAYSCYIYVLRHWSGTKAGTYALVNPIVALVLGAILLKEPLSINVLITTVLILGSVIIIQKSRLRMNPYDKKERDKHDYL